MGKTEIESDLECVYSRFPFFWSRSGNLKVKDDMTQGLTKKNTCLNLGPQESSARQELRR